MEGSEVSIELTYKSHPRFYENRTLNELSIELLDLRKNNLLNELYEKPIEEKRLIIQAWKDKYKLFEDHPLVTLGRLIRNNPTERVTARVQDLSPFLEKYETLSAEKNHLFIFEEVLGFIVGAFFELDYRNWLDHQLSVLPVNDTKERKSNTDLPKIFKEPYFDLCIMLLHECEILDDNEDLLITPGDGSELYGVIVAIQKYSRKVLIHNKFNYSKLLQLFNEFLATTYKQVKPKNARAIWSYERATALLRDKTFK